MENKRPYTVFVTLMLLSHVLLTIDVVAQDIGSEYISFSTNRNGNYDIYMIDRHGGKNMIFFGTMHVFCPKIASFIL